MNNDNRKIGEAFERRLCNLLSAYGFWCHRMKQNQQGQPFDVIVARNGVTHPIDCKVCENNTFKMSRIEENQASAMTLWRECGNGEGWFALEMSDGSVYFLTFSVLEMLSSKKSLSAEEIRFYGYTLEAWVGV